MTQEFVYFGDEAREEIALYVLEARNLLKPSGYALGGSRFPFAMHHAVYRNKLPRIDNRLPTHFKVAGLLNTWAVARHSPHDYVWQAVNGALMSAAGVRYDRNILPDAVKKKLETISFGKSFESWASARLKQRITH